MAFGRNDLLGTYSWEATRGDDPKLRGEPDANEFNRHEGYEVLYLLNKFAEKFDLQLKAFQAIERLLAELPSNLRSQKHVMDWLVNRWQTVPIIARPDDKSPPLSQFSNVPKPKLK